MIRHVVIQLLTWGFLVGAASFSELQAQAEDITFDSMTQKQGLSHSQVVTLEQDQRGFMWFGTQQGLNRFDGYEFVSYTHDPAQPGTLGHNRIESLHCDFLGRLWVGTWGGLDRYDSLTDTFVPVPLMGSSDETDGTVTAVLLDQNLRLWVGTHHGLFSQDTQTERWTRYGSRPDASHSLSNDQVRVLFEDSQGRIWVGTGSPWESAEGEGGLNLFVPEEGTFRRFLHDPEDRDTLANNWVRAMSEDSSGNLWAGTWGDGLHRYDEHRAVWVRVAYRDLGELDPENVKVPEPGFGITSIIENRMEPGVLLIGVFNGGLDMLDLLNGNVQSFSRGDLRTSGLLANSVWAIHQDRLGATWVATWAGVNLIPPTLGIFHHYPSHPRDYTSLSTTVVQSVYEDRRGHLWVATNYGLNLLDETTGAFRHFLPDPLNPASIQSTDVQEISEDGTGGLWVAADGVLYQYVREGSGQGFEALRIEPSHGEDSVGNVTFIQPAEEGFLWIGTSADGLKRLNIQNRTFAHIRHEAGREDSLSSDNVRCMMVDREGGMWIGTNSGLNRRLPGPDSEADSGWRFECFKAQFGRPGTLSHNYVNSLLESPDGGLWVGTGGGLSFLDMRTGQFQSFTERDGLPDNFICSLVYDSRGNLWISTHDGLAMLESGDDSRVFINYGPADGLPAKVFGVVSCRRRDGTLLFGGSEGLVYFRPEMLHRSRLAPQIQFTAFLKNNKPVSLVPPIYEREEIVVSHHDNVIGFEFAAMDFADPTRNRFSYQLEGLGEEWNYLGKKRDLMLTNLDPGRYQLRVQGSNSRGVWNREGASVSIVVLPPWWQTLWARSVLVLVVGAAIWGALRLQARQVRIRNQRLEQEVSERTRQLESFSYSVAHDLRAPLRGIDGFSHMLLEDYESELDSGGQNLLRRIRRSSQRMGSLIDDLLAFFNQKKRALNIQKINLSKLAEKLADQLRSNAPDREVEFRFQDELQVWADGNLIEVVMENLLGNAWKYSQGRSPAVIEFGCDDTTQPRTFFVKDNGAGFDMEFKEKVFAPFQRLHSEEEFEGNGIGLATVKQIIERHDGRIWVESEVDVGTTFYFTLHQGRG